MTEQQIFFDNLQKAEAKELIMQNKKEQDIDILIKTKFREHCENKDIWDRFIDTNSGNKFNNSATVVKERYRPEETNELADRKMAEQMAKLNNERSTAYAELNKKIDKLEASVRDAMYREFPNPMFDNDSPKCVREAFEQQADLSSEYLYEVDEIKTINTSLTFSEALQKVNAGKNEEIKIGHSALGQNKSFWRVDDYIYTDSTPNGQTKIAVKQDVDYLMRLKPEFFVIESKVTNSTAQWISSNAGRELKTEQPKEENNGQWNYRSQEITRRT